MSELFISYVIDSLTGGVNTPTPTANYGTIRDQNASPGPLGPGDGKNIRHL